jgi:hypothetical protein
MPADQPGSPVLNVSAIDFPTDRLTLGQLRRFQPEVFETLDGDVTDIEALPTFDLERALARKSFALALGLPDPHPDDDRQVSIRTLDRDYRRYSLSSGLQSTQQLVREFERAAAEQAKAFGGPGHA